ncbi:DoxX family protein [Raineyella fluvialis]|uniref:DoxX family membrane protein n=1 Tax=Raineyella fluvialis TaxID=2662261 RepID=A0A5Q2FIF2_9ACTN|nr:DoxX family membrane protein [Raineyella fluvialis]QGF24435.1 DoxX family membrane protein [Raineyella fluvialis]
MALSRAVARTMLAGVFISQGVKGVTDPGSTTAQGAMLRDRVAPFLRRVAPEPIASHLPEDAITWARIRGAAEVAAGIGLSTGLGRRWGALTLAAFTVQDLITAGGGRKALKDPDLLTRIALTGGVLLAAQDTEGRPSLGYRSRVARGHLEAKGRKARKSVRKAERRLEGAAKDTGKRIRTVATETKSGLAA